METNQRIVIAKPVASRPSCSNVYSNQTNIVAAIRPKTVRLNPINSHGKECNATNNVVYKPLAKVVPNTIIPFLGSSYQPSDLTNGSSLKTSIPLVCDVERPNYDDYKWRKYGQKHVKGSQYPRSYYKCTNPNCPVKKMVERSLDGQIVEIVYKGEHNHFKPQPPKKNSKEIITNEVGTIEMANVDQMTDVLMLENGLSGDICEELDQLKNKKRKIERVVAKSTSNETANDGFRWRKYGQKVVKGSQYPRSYYRCTGPKCNVRKHIERVSDDPNAFITTYEGKHNHDMLFKRTID